MKKLLDDPLFRISFTGLIFAAIFAYVFFAFAKHPTDSDLASFALEADEMLKGNFFLKGWNLTGATFVFSEIPFYMIGVLVFGLSVRAIILANSLMITLIIFLGFQLLPAKRSRWIDFLYLSLTAFPGPYLIASSLSHCGIFALSLTGFVLIKKLLERHSAQAEASAAVWILYIIVLALGTASDVFILPILAVPVLLYALRSLVANDFQRKRFYLLLISATLAGIIIGKAAEWGYLAISGAELNSRTFLVTFNSIEFIRSSFYNLIEGTLQMTGAYVPEMSIFSYGGLTSLARFLLLVLMTGILIKDFIAILKQPQSDPLSEMIAAGMITLASFLLIAPFLYILNTGRYYSYFPAAFVVLLCRWITRSGLPDKKFMNEKIAVRIPLIAAAIFLLVSSYKPVSFERTAAAQDRLATYLTQNNLTNGFADFWQANHTTVSSGKQVSIAAITFNQINGASGAHPYYWFSKDEWYTDPQKNFVVVSGDPYHDVTVENVIRYFGNPKSEERFEDYTILVYNPGIEKFLTEKKR